MFSLPDFSVKRPVCVFICLASLVIFGVSSVFSMPMESTPEMTSPMFTVMTSYSGASPDEVDEMVTDRIESALSSISEVESMSSTSSEGSSMVMLEFGYDVDLDDKYQDITSALAMVNLPDGCNDPTVMQMDMSSSNSTIMNLSVATDSAENMASYVEDTIVPELERIAGVAEVSVSGGAREYIRITLDEERMTQYGLTMKSIASTISSAEYETTLGELNRGNVSLSLIGSSDYDSWKDLENIPISLSSGDVIYLSDVATVELAEQEQSSYSRQNGQENISISISKEQSGNTVSICSQISQLVEELNAGGLGLELEITSNSGETISENIYSVFTSLVEGLVISALVLVFFFGEWKSSLIVGVSMPISVLAALILMAVFDMSINLMSLGGLVVGIGMMVDSAIVVMDSCFKSVNDGLDYTEAVHVGANLVTSSIIASTATTVVVFLPIAMMDGMSGQLFRDVCYTVVFSLVASTLSALTLVPLLFVRMRPVEKLDNFSHHMMERLETRYESILRLALGARKTVVAIALACLAGAAFLFTQIDMELMATGSSNQINVSVQTRTGLDLDSTNEIMTQIEALVADDPDVESYSLRVSGGGGGMRGMGGSSGAGSLSITLKEDSSVTTDEYIQALRTATAGIQNCQVEVSEQQSMSFGGSGVELSLSGADLSNLEEAADAIKEQLSTMEEFDSVTTSLSDGSPRAKIEVDPILAGSVGMTPSEVLSDASNKLGGMTATNFTQDGTEYSVEVVYPSDRFEYISDLSGLMIDTPSGGQVALTDIAEVEYETAPSSISREDGDYVVTVSATPKTGLNARNLSQQALQLAGQVSLPDGVTLAQGSSMNTMNTEFGAIGQALVIAVYLVFAVMAIQFESLVFSGVVMFSIPFSLTGAFLALYITGSSISMTSLLGLVMLAGIVVNNAIVLVDYANILRQEGAEVHEALVLAGKRRLRPILMSSITTIVGLIPMAMGSGGDVAMMQGMAVVVIGGLSLSTVLTLVLIPTVALIFDREDRQNRRRERRERKQAAAAN